MGGLPDEVEFAEDSTYLSPVGSGKYLWSANPDSGRVARIDAATLSVLLAPAGLKPTQTLGFDGEREGGALVLNEGSSDVSYFRKNEGILNEKRAKIHPGANQLRRSESGDFALVFSVEKPEPKVDPGEVLQEVSFLDLREAEPKVKTLAVAYRPAQVVFAEATGRALILWADGISRIDLEEGSVDGYLDLGAGEGRDVSILENGAFALVRRNDQSDIEVFDLETLSVAGVISLSAPVTDLDFSPDGRGLAVMRSESRVSTFPFPEVLEDPSTIDTVDIEGETIGSVALSSDGKSAILYTNAVPKARVTILNLTEGADLLAYRSLSVSIPVERVRISPDGEHALIWPRSGETAFVLLALRQERFPRVIRTEAQAIDLAIANQVALVSTSGGGQSEAYWVELPSFAEQHFELPSEPLSVGFTAESELGFVA